MIFHFGVRTLQLRRFMVFMEEFERYPFDFDDENALRLRGLIPCRIQNSNLGEMTNEATFIEA